MKLRLIQTNPIKNSKTKSLLAASSNSENGVCTLILPQRTHRRYKKHWDTSKSATKCLKELLETYSGSIDRIERLNSNPIFVRYQRAKTKTTWVRINFRPRQSDWIKLGNLARFHGVSRCFLFVYLLERFLTGDRPAGSLSIKQKRAA
ncbi:hypothetical protein CH373_01965 [Leptospira perolatii]|uniref:DUF1564 domain-containing protein n=1 Tax=Leptospira perolatii TaxID=2023191 RepID=A0A2M9ZRV9_9LEPT|nr:hypothetical protein CH360_01965 [Leptospira perolatii]PJZ74827.1 hypothetical protein CH373_01965 [Leptospira perolatii]